MRNKPTFEELQILFDVLLKENQDLKNQVGFSCPGKGSLTQEISDQQNPEISFEKSFRNHDAIMFLLNAETWMFVDVNFAAEKFYGYTLEQFKKMKIGDINMLSANELNAERNKALKTVKYFIVPHLLANGEVRTVEVHTTPIVTKKTRYLFSIIHDITERKQNELVIQQQNKELLELNATKDKLFSLIAHDLKGPFISLIGLCSLLTESVNNKDVQEIKTYSDFINKAANETFKLLENLLEWSGLQQGAIKPNITTNNFKTIVAEIYMLYTEIAVLKNIALQNNINEDFLISCDKEMTKSVLRNLISNAIKFSKRDGLVSINACYRNDVLEVQIKDSGIGIPQNYIQHLFNIDKNISRRGTAGEKGTGLGLVLCRELIEKQGGAIWAESKEGEGSTFYFTLNK